MTDILLPVLLIALCIFGGLLLGFSAMKKRFLYIILLFAMTALCIFVMYNYDSRMGYPVKSNLPDKFMVVGYTQLNRIHYLWIIPDKENIPRAYIINPKSMKKMEHELQKMIKEMSKGNAVEGNKKKKKNGSDSDEFSFNVIDPTEHLTK